MPKTTIPLSEIKVRTAKPKEKPYKLSDEDETIWLTQKLMATLFDVGINTINYHLKDIYATSVDYNADAPTTKAFFAKVQNKLHFAVHGHTAAELIMQRADSAKTNMGLTTWEKAPGGKTLKTDVSVAKNYLTKDELESLGRIVNATWTLPKTAPAGKSP